MPDDDRTPDPPMMNNAAMQRLEIYGRPIIEGSTTAPDEAAE